MNHSHFATAFPESLPYNDPTDRKGGSAITVVYVDSVFLLNTLMDYLLLLATARLAGVPLRRKRYILGGLAGGIYAVAVFLPGMSFLGAVPVKVTVGVLLALIAFGGEEKLSRLTLLLFLVSCALAGGVLGLGLLAGSPVPVINGVFYTDVNARVLLAASVGAYVLMTVVFRAAAKHGLSGELVPVRLCLRQRIVTMTALLDTGNALRDPMSGEAVLVVAPDALRAALPPEVKRLLTAERLRFPADLLEPLRQSAPGWRFQLIPYHAVGTAGGLLLAVRTEWTDIAGERHPGLLAALSPTGLGNGYGALWGGQVRKGGRYEHISYKAPAVDSPAGSAAVREHSLYRRK